MLDLNADVLTGTTDSPSLAQAAAARGKYAVGVDYDQSSYAPQAILQLCESAVWLDQGGVVANGPAPQVVDAFVSRFAPQALSAAG